MNSSIQGYDEPKKPSIVKKGVAGVILVIVAALALKLVIGFVMGIFWIIVAVAAIIAVAWAAKTVL
jgi:hypothetical protein